MQEVRCSGIYKGKPCNRLLFKANADKGYDIQIKCPKCGDTWRIYQSELMDFSGNKLDDFTLSIKNISE